MAPSDADARNAGANLPSNVSGKSGLRVEEDAESLIRHHSGEAQVTSDPGTRHQAWGAATNNDVSASAFSGSISPLPSAPLHFLPALLCSLMLVQQTQPQQAASKVAQTAMQ